MQSPKEKIASFHTSHKRMPSYSELYKLLGYKSKGAAVYAGEQLVSSGVIKRDKTGRLGIPMLGQAL